MVHTQLTLSTHSKRILIATIGSLGDLHPCLALARELRHRGHSVTVASTPFYRERVEALGTQFYPLRPDWDPTTPELIRQCEDLKRGPEVLFRNIVLPHLRDTYDDLLAAAAEADFMLAGEMVFPAPLVAEKLHLRWGSLILSPCSFFSAYDPSILVNVPWLIHFRKAGRQVYRAMLNLGRLGIRHWWNPVRELRHEQGLSSRCDPLFQDKFSPHLVLALFSPSLALPQPDWPRQTVQPGFVFYEEANTCPAAGLTEFLASGDPPIVFTLGSTAVHNPGNFFEASVEAARTLGRRSILLGANEQPRNHTLEVLALPYAPYSEVFPHAAAIVHQGGSGTTAQALRAGRPMLIVPYGWDQPDNGARVQRRGAGLCLPRKDYSADLAAAAINRLLTDPTFARCTAHMGERVRTENGLTRAVCAIESLLQRH